MGQTKKVVAPPGHHMVGHNKIVQDKVVPVDPVQAAHDAADAARKAVDDAAALAEAAGLNDEIEESPATDSWDAPNLDEDDDD